MNTDIIVIEGKGNAADSVSVMMTKQALARRGITEPKQEFATSETLNEVFNAALARSNVIVILGGIGSEPEDNAVKTVADVLGEDCEMNFSALGKIASSYARKGIEMPESAAKAATVMRNSKAINNPVGTSTGCAVAIGSQFIMLLPGAADEVGAMLDNAAGDFIDLAVKKLNENDTNELEFNGFDGADKSDDASNISFNPNAITADETVNAFEAVVDATDFSEPVIDAEIEAEPVAAPADELVIAADIEEAIEPNDISIAVVTEPDATVEKAAEPKPEEYVVLTPSKKEKAEPETDGEEYVELAEAAAAPEQAVKEPFGKRLLKFFVPWKGDKAVDILRKIVFAIAIIGLIISSCYIGDFFIKMSSNKQVLDEARDLYDPSNTEYNEETHVYNRFDQLIAQNSDCVGWISVPNTKIDNPVYKTTDNDFYLTNNNKKQPSVYGAIFADYRDGITVHGNSQNITLYGHHMKDGTMFADLHKYKKMSFYKENPVISFDTLYGNGGQYKVFACFITNSDPMDDNGYFFDFAVPNYDSELDFMNWVEQVRRRSIYSTPVDVVATDEILTLSTCTYEVKEHNLLCVVVARKVRDGETAAVNTINTSTNSRIIYPAVWYEKLGGQKPTYADGLYTWVSGDYNREDINAPTDTSSLAGTSNAPSSEGASSAAASSGGASTEAASSGAASSEAASAPSSSAAPPASSDAASSEAASSAAPPESSVAPPESSAAASSEASSQTAQSEAAQSGGE